MAKSNPDTEWVELFNEALSTWQKERTGKDSDWGAKAALAKVLEVNDSTISRISNGENVSNGLLYRASLEVGIRLPTNLPLDALQQRILKALVKVRDSGGDQWADAFVKMIEFKADRLYAAAQRIRESVMDVPVHEDAILDDTDELYAEWLEALDAQELKGALSLHIGKRYEDD